MDTVAVAVAVAVAVIKTKTGLSCKSRLPGRINGEIKFLDCRSCRIPDKSADFTLPVCFFPTFLTVQS